MTKNHLSGLRNGDRETMCQQVEAIVAAAGALCVRRLDDAWKPRCMRLQIAAPGGLTVNLSLDDGAGRLHSLHFLHWNMESGSPNRLRPGFGGVDARHFCKATHVAYSFEALCEQLELSLRLAATGAAYQPARQPAGSSSKPGERVDAGPSI